MKNIRKYTAMSLLVMIFVSCNDDDFLDLTPQQSIADVNFLKSMSDFNAALIGMYDALQSSNWYGRYMLLVPDVMGEDVKQNASANRAKEWAEFVGSPQDFIPENFWFNMYQGINMANAVLNSDFEPAAASVVDFNQLKGEAYAMRGLAYFDLVRLFGQHYTFTGDASHPGVPIVLEFDVTAKPARNSVAQVYTQIISDFNSAVSNMSKDVGPGRFTKESVQALLSRVYLYQENWSKADEMASAVINSGKFTLATSTEYPTMFLDGKSSESILEIQFSVADGLGSNHVGAMYKVTGYGDYLPSKDFMDLYAAGDVRGTMFLTDANLSGAYCCDRVDKWPSEGGANGTDNISVTRLSELYLNRAEARAQTGNDAGAQADLNLIRKRGLSTATDITLTGNELLAEVLVERRRELSFEGHRIFDISRYKGNVNRGTDQCTSTTCLETYPNNRYILPIPIEEMDVNENMVQNPGY
jgi:hypothetical protein